MSPVETRAPGRRKVGAALHEEALRLSRMGVTEAVSKVTWVLSDLLKCPHLELSLHARAWLSADQEEALEAAIDRLSRHEPVQYVAGSTHFMGCDIVVDRRVLIPRPETELLVEHALRGLGARRSATWYGADIGTGSGCVAIAMARACPAARLVAIDISEKALEVAAVNVARSGVASQIELQQQDLLAGIAENSLDLVVSNPPYVASSDYDSLPPELRYEPWSALDGGEGGLGTIRRLVPQAAVALRGGGLFVLEIGEKQGDDVCRLLRIAGFSRISLHADFAGKDRIVESTRQ